MKRSAIIVALAVVLVLAFAATALATSPKMWNRLEDYYSWGSQSGYGTGDLLSSVGANPSNPGVHANYMANTAKCGICHSVHRARYDGVKLLNTTVATCAGCHRAGTGAISSKLVSWESGGPHSSGNDGNCTNRRCHIDSPHGVGVSSYKLLGGKLIASEADEVIDAALASGTDAARGWNATDLNNAVGDYTLTAGEQSALVTGYTCNQSNCHGNTMLPVIAKNWGEVRGAIYPNDDFMNIASSLTTTKTGHLSSAVASATYASYAPVDGCTSCHDQTDAGTTSGFTFPHSQTAYGASNLTTPGASPTPVSGLRAYLWMGWGGDITTPLNAVTETNMRAYDGTCLKCHRNGAGSGIGLTH